MGRDRLPPEAEPAEVADVAAAPSRRDLFAAVGLATLAACAPEPEPAPEEPAKRRRPPEPELPKLERRGEPRNIVVILTDDLRADPFGFLGHPHARTPNLDKLATEGAWAANAFVTTALCSPSRASMLTGLYAHKHGVHTNTTELPRNIPTYAGWLKANGYDTAYIGKWHMGETMRPRAGWNRWVSFKHQGYYEYPGKRHKPEEISWNVDGEVKAVAGYVTDLLTDYAVDWLKTGRDADKPFLMVVSHKAVHAPLVPAERHRGEFADLKFPEPLPDTDEAYAGLPKWLRAMRQSELGVEKVYGVEDKDEWYRNYFRCLLAVDESVGKLREALTGLGLWDDTLVLFTSDNGFMFGEKGVVDKRSFYEPSVRIPLIASCPALFPARGKLQRHLLNVDLCPTILDAAGLVPPDDLHGRSYLPILEDKPGPWREGWMYEYFFERTFPETPTVLGLRKGRHKLVTYHGVWERDELYDLDADPGETTNLALVKENAPLVRELGAALRKEAERLGCRWNPSWKRGQEEEPAAEGEVDPG